MQGDGECSSLSSPPRSSWRSARRMPSHGVTVLLWFASVTNINWTTSLTITFTCWTTSHCTMPAQQKTKAELLAEWEKYVEKWALRCCFELTLNPVYHNTTESTTPIATVTINTNIDMSFFLSPYSNSFLSNISTKKPVRCVFSVMPSGEELVYNRAWVGYTMKCTVRINVVRVFHQLITDRSTGAPRALVP